jgi:hypothetical protein
MHGKRALLNFEGVFQLMEATDMLRPVPDISSRRPRHRVETLAALRAAFEKAGVEFTKGRRPGVRIAT